MKTVIILIILMSFIAAIFGKSKSQSDQIVILNVTSFKEAISQGNVQLVDVRTSLEYKSGHIENAINIDFFKHKTFIKAFEKLDKNKAVYLYCRSGNRSQKAARKLIDLGFKKVYDLKGGYKAWN